MIPVGWSVAAGTSLTAALLFGLLIDAKQDLAAEREQCNTEKMAAVAEAERVTRDAQAAAYQQKIADLVEQAERAENARAIAEEAARLADSRLPEIREVIRESTDACLDAPVPDAIADSLR